MTTSMSDWDPLLRNFYFKSVWSGIVCFSVLTFTVIGLVNYPYVNANFDNFPVIDYSNSPYEVDDAMVNLEYVFAALIFIRIMCTRQVAELLGLRCLSLSRDDRDNTCTAVNHADVKSSAHSCNHDHTPEQTDEAEVKRNNPKLCNESIAKQTDLEKQVEINGIVSSVNLDTSTSKAENPTEVLHYLNNLKSFVILLVLVAHTIVEFIGFSGWYASIGAYRSKFNYVMNTFLLLGQGFGMSLMFFIAGYFTPKSFHRSKPRKQDTLKSNVFYRRREFLDARFVRIGVPFILFYMGLNPLVRAFARNYIVLSPYHDEDFKKYVPKAGTTWFLFLLLIFNTAYACMQKPPVVNRDEKSVTPKFESGPSTIQDMKTRTSIRSESSNQLVSAIALKSGAGEDMHNTSWQGKQQIWAKSIAAGLLTGFAQGIQVGWFPSMAIVPIYASSFCFYILFYCAGIRAYHKNWLRDSLPSVSMTDRWCIQAFVTFFVVTLFVVFYLDYEYKLQIYLPVNECDTIGVMGYLLNGQRKFWLFAVIICTLMGSFTTTFSLMVLDLFYRRLNFTNWLLTYVSDVTYMVYFIHPLVMVPISYLWYEIIKDEAGQDFFWIPNNTFTSSCVGGDDMLLKGWFFTLGLTLLLIYPLAGILRAIPGVRNIL